MSDTSESLIIAVLIIVALMFLLQIELYRNMLSVINYYAPEAAPPMELRFSQTFLDKKMK